MKKTLLFFLALTIFSNVSFAHIPDDPAASARMGIMRLGSVFKVFYKGTSISRVTVNIYDAKGLRVFSDNLGKQKSFARPYNFSELAEGTYTIELIDIAGKQIESVEYKQGKIEKLASLIKMSGEINKFLLIVPGKGDDVLNVRILNDSGEELYQGEEKVNGDFAKTYDLKSLSGSFSLSITDSKGATKTLSYRSEKSSTDF